MLTANDRSELHNLALICWLSFRWVSLLPVNYVYSERQHQPFTL